MGMQGNVQESQQLGGASLQVAPCPKNWRGDVGRFQNRRRWRSSSEGNDRGTCKCYPFAPVTTMIGWFSLGDIVVGERDRESET